MHTLKWCTMSIQVPFFNSLGYIPRGGIIESYGNWAPKSLQTVTAATKLKDACSSEGKLWWTWHIKKQRHHFADKGPYSWSYGFSSSYIWMWELDHKEGWALKNWCFWIVVLEKTLESPLDSKEIRPVNTKGKQPWMFIGKTDVKAEVPILWLPDAKHLLMRKDPDAERLKAGGEGDDRGWNGLMASPTQWTWVWASCGRWWRTGKLGVL